MAAPNVPFFKQEEGNFCGAACMKMVIESLNPSSPSQTTLFNSANSHGQLDPPSIDWASPPDGVEFVLENKGGLRSTAVAILSVDSETALTRQVVWSLVQHSVAPIVLVWGWQHWVVVVGVEIEGTPTGPTDTGYTIKSLMIHDPAPAIGDDHPPPPWKVTFSKWKNEYLMPVPDGHWQGARVAVGVFTP